ncbi:MAG: hypothetical protein SFU25_02525, partial [Candidatus Caenarcaniphilales bacterium]|nr:hypothetical protein [Candidatus Caenarcaniphilales bacterium]
SVVVSMVGGQDLGIRVIWRAPDGTEHRASAGQTSNGDLITARHTFGTQPKSQISLADTSGRASQADSFNTVTQTSRDSSIGNSTSGNNHQNKVTVQVVDHTTGKVLEENTGTATFNGDPNLTNAQGVLSDTAKIKLDKPFQTKVEQFDIVKPGEKFENFDMDTVRVENPNPNGKPIGDQNLKFAGISQEGIMQFENPNGLLAEGASGAPITAEINGVRKIIGYVSVGNDGTIHSPFLGAQKPSEDLKTLNLVT